MTDQVTGHQAPQPASVNNKRTALILLSIALAFFAGIIAKYWLLSGG